MTVTRKEEIKWRHRPFTTVIDTSFENPPIHEDHPMRPYEHTNVYALQSGTLSFKPTNPGEIRTLIGLHLAMGVMKMPRVSMYWEGGMDIGILRMITHAFDMAVVNSWLEYRLDAKRANIQTKDIQDLLHFKMNVAQCLVRVHKTVAAKRGRLQSHSMYPRDQFANHLRM